MHARIVAEHPVGDALSCADTAFLGPLKGSAAFAAVRDRLTEDRHLDSWQEDGLHFFVFQLRTSDAEARPRGDPEAPVAVFAMHPESSEPVAAVTVTPQPGGAEAEVRDLRAPDTAYVAGIAPSVDADNGTSAPSGGEHHEG